VTDELIKIVQYSTYYGNDDDDDDDWDQGDEGWGLEMQTRLKPHWQVRAFFTIYTIVYTNIFYRYLLTMALTRTTMTTVGIKETKAGACGQQPQHLNVDGWGSKEGS
jgi:hypothetical protein